jgi:hypothetical protein
VLDASIPSHRGVAVSPDARYIRSAIRPDAAGYPLSRLRLPGATIEWISPLWRNQRFDIADDLIVIDQIATPRGQGPRPTFVGCELRSQSPSAEALI